MPHQLFTAAKPVPGQSEIPMGTHHVCPACSNSFVCDVAECAIDLRGANCAHCQPPELAHSQWPVNLEAHNQRFAAELRRREKPADYQRDLFQQEMF